MDIKHAVMKRDTDIRHPFESDLSFLYGTIFIGEPVSEGIDSRKRMHLCRWGSRSLSDGLRSLR